MRQGDDGATSLEYVVIIAVFVAILAGIVVSVIRRDVSGGFLPAVLAPAVLTILSAAVSALVGREYGRPARRVADALKLRSTRRLRGDDSSEDGAS